MRVSEWRRLRTAGETSGVRAGEASELLGSRTSARTSGNFWELLGSDQVSSPFRSPEPTQLETRSDPISPTGFREPVSGQDYAVSRASLADCRVSRFREETHQVLSSAIHYELEIVVGQEVQAQHGGHLKLRACLGLAGEFRYNYERTYKCTGIPIDKLHVGITQGAIDALPFQGFG